MYEVITAICLVARDIFHIIVVLFLKLWKAQYLEASLLVGTEMRNARLEYVADLIEKVTQLQHYIKVTYYLTYTYKSGHFRSKQHHLK